MPYPNTGWLRSSNCRLASLPMLGGIEPCRAVEYSRRDVKETMLPIWDGIWSTRVALMSRCLRELSAVICDVIAPVSMLFDKSRYVREVKAPIAEGIGPQNAFAFRFR